MCEVLVVWVAFTVFGARRASIILAMSEQLAGFFRQGASGACREGPSVFAADRPPPVVSWGMAGRSIFASKFYIIHHSYGIEKSSFELQSRNL